MEPSVQGEEKTKRAWHRRMADHVAHHAKRHATHVALFIREHHVSLAIVTGFLVVSSFIIGGYRSSATVSSVAMYPSECSGVWPGVGYSSGEPDALGHFDLSNSAVLISPTNESITCRGFSGTAPQGMAPTGASIRIIASEGSLQNIPSQNEILPEPATPAETSEAPEVTEPSPEVIPATPDASEEPAQEEIVSFFKNIFTSVAHAQESAPQENLAPAPEVSPAEISTPQELSEENSEPEPEAPAEIPDEATTAPSVEPVEAIVSESSESSDHEYFEVQYSLDGHQWSSAGIVDTVSINDALFDLPNISPTDLRDLSLFAIKLVPVAGSAASVFVDAIELNVEYQEIQPILNPPTITIKDSSLVMVGGDSFNSSDTPSFTVTDPGLTVADVAQLVDDHRAEIVSDSAGVLDSESPNGLIDSMLPNIAPVIDAAQNVLEQVGGAIQDMVTPETASAEAPLITNATVVDSDGNETDIEVSIEPIIVDGVEKQKITIIKPEHAFRPGRYTLKITMQTPQVIIISEQDFAWGVLAFNADRTIYSTGDTAYLQMGVLDDHGHTICDADLSVTITTPAGTIDTLSTQAGSVEQSGLCARDNVVDVPDYFAHYSFTESGDYAVMITATTANGTRSIVDRLRVAATRFDVERIGPTRIYPVESYPVTMKIKPDHDWIGVITEIVPSNFAITQPINSLQYSSIQEQGDTKIISWNVNLIAGQETVIGYHFDAPDISPEFYLLGPLVFTNNEGGKDFQETREWQIASDATCTTNGTGGGNWNTGATWSGCAGAGGIPATGDNITITAGDTVTMDVNSPVLGTITVNGTLNTSNGTSRSLSGTTISIGAAGTLTANASTITLSGTTGTIFTLTSGGTFTAGTSTVLMNGNGSVTTTSGVITFYNLSLRSNQVTTAKTYTMGSGAITVNNNLLIQPTNTTDLRLTVSMGAAITVAGSTTVAGNTNADATFDTTASNYAFSTGTLGMVGSTTVITANASNITLTGTSGTLFTFAGTFTAGTSTVTLSGNGTATINSGSPSFYKLVSSGTGTKTLGASITVSNELTISNGTFNGGSSTLSLSGTTGTPLIISGSGIFDGASGTVSYTGDNAGGNTTITSSGVTYNNLTINVTGETFELAGATVVVGTTTVTLGTLTTTASNYALSTGAIVIANSAAAIFTANGSYITLTGTSGALVTRSGTNAVFNAGTSTIDMAGNGNATSTGATAVTFNNIVSSGTGTKTTGTITMTGDLTVTNGTFAATALTGSGTNAMTVTNATVNAIGTGAAGGFISAGGSYRSFETVTLGVNSTVDFASASGQVIDVVTYVNLTVSGGSNKNLLGTTTVTGTFTVKTGPTFSTTASNFALNAGSISIESGGIFTANNSAITVTGNWTNAGTFTQGNSTVTFNGAATATITGTTTFYNLTITHSAAKQVNFATASTPIYHISHTFTVTGHSSALIKLRSDSGGTKWQVDPTGTAAIDYADVKDGGCEVTAIQMAPTNSISSGNNDSCWGLAAAQTLSFSLSDSSIGFGALSASTARYCTGDTLGSASETSAFTFDVATNAASGYFVSVIGSTLTSASNTITAIGGTNTASSSGAEQFGMRFTASGGSGTVSSPYAASGFAYAANGVTSDEVASASSGDGVTTTYSARCIANISSATEPGAYTTTMTYVVTGNF